MNLSRPDRADRLDALAAMYALGTLSGRARARLARIARTDTAVAVAVRTWENRLSPLAEGAPGITPSPRVWKVIALRLGLDPDREALSAPWWRRVGVWRTLAAASFAGVVALSVALLRPVPDVPDQPLVVVLAGQDARPALIATAARGDRIMTVKVVGGAPVPSDRALELWMLPDGQAPRSLGVVPASGVGRVTLPATPEVAFAGVPALAISLEQAGGSPTGAPQGPVLYTGRIERMY
jgi:anti-sigma-K factor RskA